MYQNKAWENETGFTLDPTGRPFEKREEGESIKAETKTITNNLDRHFHLMNRLVCQGMERDEASQEAYKVIIGRKA